MFRTVPLSIVSSFSLYTQQWYMSYRFADSLTASRPSLFASCLQTCEQAETCLFLYLWCENINSVNLEFSAVTCRSALSSLQQPVTLIVLFVAHLVSVTSDVCIQTQALRYSLTNLITFSVHSITATTGSANWQLPFTRSCLIIFDVSFPRQPFAPKLLMS